MPRKNTLKSFKIINAGDMSQSTVTSTISNIEFMDNVGMQFSWTGSSPVGAISVQVSVDHAQDSQGVVSNDGTWTSLSISPAISVTGNTGSYYIDLNQLGAPWVRAVYTKTSGTGTLTGYICGKEI